MKTSPEGQAKAGPRVTSRDGKEEEGSSAAATIPTRQRSEDEAPPEGRAAERSARGAPERQGRAHHRRRPRHRPRGRASRSRARAPTSRSSISTSTAMPPRPRRMVEEEGRRCLAIAGDVGDESFCKRAVVARRRRARPARRARQQRRRAASRRSRSEDISRRAARADVSHQHLRDVLPDEGGAAAPRKGASIINTTSVTAYRGSPQLIDYSSTKGAIVAFTRSLAQSLVERASA